MNSPDTAKRSPGGANVESSPPDAPRSWPRRIVALILLAFGLALAVGGAILAANGGSLYYLITGLAYILSGFLLWRGDARGVWIYGAMLIGSVAWSL